GRPDRRPGRRRTRPHRRGSRWAFERLAGRDGTSGAVADQPRQRREHAAGGKRPAEQRRTDLRQRAGHDQRAADHPRPAFLGTHVLAVVHPTTSICPITASIVGKEGHSDQKDSDLAKKGLRPHGRGLAFWRSDSMAGVEPVVTADGLRLYTRVWP